MERLIVITADDVIRAGACESGVYRVLNRLHPNIAASTEVEKLIDLLNDNEKQYVISSAMLNGNGYGDGGYGYCDGYGDGGNGDGGNGYGYGDGYGYGGNGYGD